jgi:predicted RecA/RadA family phage recombinase
MATNRVQEVGNRITAVCTAPTTPTSGAPVLIGQIPGVALIAEAADGETVVQTDGVFDLSVEAANNSTGSAVAVGDILYYDGAASVKINKDNVAGVRYGYALGAVTSGATATIPVKIGY